MEPLAKQCIFRARAAAARDKSGRAFPQKFNVASRTLPFPRVPGLEASSANGASLSLPALAARPTLPAKETLDAVGSWQVGNSHFDA